MLTTASVEVGAVPIISLIYQPLLTMLITPLDQITKLVVAAELLIITPLEMLRSVSDVFVTPLLQILQLRHRLEKLPSLANILVMRPRLAPTGCELGLLLLETASPVDLLLLLPLIHHTLLLPLQPLHVLRDLVQLLLQTKGVIVVVTLQRLLGPGLPQYLRLAPLPLTDLASHTSQDSGKIPDPLPALRDLGVLPVGRGRDLQTAHRCIDLTPIRLSLLHGLPCVRTCRHETLEIPLQGLLLLGQLSELSGTHDCSMEDNVGVGDDVVMNVKTQWT